jgi:hypothetical protein
MMSFLGVTTSVVSVEGVVKTLPLDSDPIFTIVGCLVAENAVSSSCGDRARDLGFHIPRG